MTVVTVSIPVAHARIIPSALWSLISADGPLGDDESGFADDIGSDAINAVDALAMTIFNAAVSAEGGAA